MRPTASTRIIEGSGVIVTFSCWPITCATIAPTWLFISVNPHMLDAVLSDLSGLSAVLKPLTEVTGPAPSVLADPDPTGSRRTGSWRGRDRPRSVAVARRA